MDISNMNQPKNTVLPHIIYKYIFCIWYYNSTIEAKKTLLAIRENCWNFPHISERSRPWSLTA